MSGLLIVIPCLNEAAHLSGLLDRLRAEAARDARIVVADGGSSDGSADIVRQHASADPRVTLLMNPARLQSAAVNLAVRTFGADAEHFVRVDAHAGYPPNFLANLEDAARETGADSIAVSMRAVSDTGGCFQRAAAAAQNSLLGAGGSAHRKSGARRWVDHGHHALFKTSAFLAVSGYDESFTHNEDAELDARLAANDAKILLAADIVIDYFPRASAGALARQYFNYGKGRARTVRKHKMALKPRQAAPIVIAPAIALAALAPITPWAALPAAAWLVICLGVGALLGARETNFCAAGAGIPAAIMHAAWSAGFLRQTFAPPRPAASNLTLKETSA